MRGGSFPRHSIALLRTLRTVFLAVLCVVCLFCLSLCSFVWRLSSCAQTLPIVQDCKTRFPLTIKSIQVSLLFLLL